MPTDPTTLPNSDAEFAKGCGVTDLSQFIKPSDPRATDTSGMDPLDSFTDDEVEDMAAEALVGMGDDDSGETGACVDDGDDDDPSCGAPPDTV